MRPTLLILLVALTLAVTSCGITPPIKTPINGPLGKSTENKPSLSWLQHLSSPPTGIYDLEQIAGLLFSAINSENWEEAQNYFNFLNEAWQKTKPNILDKKSVDETSQIISLLNLSVQQKRLNLSHNNLNKFMHKINEMARSYYLSPSADIIGINIVLRNVAFALAERDWKQSALKAKELENTWQQMKPSIEQLGIIGEITTTHALIKQLKDAVSAENEIVAKGHLSKINQSMGRIRNFYQYH